MVGEEEDETDISETEPLKAHERKFEGSTEDGELEGRRENAGSATKQVTFGGTDVRRFEQSERNCMERRRSI